MSTEPSTEPLPGEAAASPEATSSCSSCGSAIAHDQRYCLECGERLAPVSGFLLGRPQGSGAESPPSAPPDAPPIAGERAPRSNVLGVLGGVGLLLLAMGVGVLIGRAGNSKPAPAREQVITEQAPAASTGTAGTEASFTGDWRTSRSGYTVQLSTLPSSSTRAAVTAAKTAATAKGAPAVGALASSEFSSLASGSDVIYSGDYKSAGQARKALARLRHGFPSAKVIHVTGGGSGGGAGKGGSTANGGSSGSSPSVHSSLSHPAPPSVLKTLKGKGKGKSYVEASKNLPDVVETG